jgi:hypothetical protein
LMKIFVRRSRQVLASPSASARRPIELGRVRASPTLARLSTERRREPLRPREFYLRTAYARSTLLNQTLPVP